MRLKNIAFIAISSTSLLMSACSPMNSEFSCNATASDSCMTIEQVDAMTHYADGARTQNAHSAYQQKRGNPAHPYVWVTPKNDERLHELGAAQNPTLNAHG